MEKVLFYAKKYGKDAILFLLLTVCLGLMIYSTFIKEEKATEVIDELAFTDLGETTEEKTEQEEKVKFHVDIKGAVKTPGVYEVDNTTIINDVIKLAGGFQSNAYQNGINMSKKVSDEMVIYVYTKNEIAKYQKENETTNIVQEVSCKTPDYNICECVNGKQSIIEVGDNSSNPNNSQNSNGNNSSNSNETKIVNINTATSSELTTLNGIGESKAQAIIKYREENGNFTSIEDIKKVSGIGDSAFEKIKDFITV